MYDYKIMFEEIITEFIILHGGPFQIKEDWTFEIVAGDGTIIASIDKRNFLLAFDITNQANNIYYKYLEELDGLGAE